MKSEQESWKPLPYNIFNSFACSGLTHCTHCYEHRPVCITRTYVYTYIHANMYNTNSQLLIQSARRTSAVSCPSIGGKQATNQPASQQAKDSWLSQETYDLERARVCCDCSERVRAAAVTLRQATQRRQHPVGE